MGLLTAGMTAQLGGATGVLGAVPGLSSGGRTADLVEILSSRTMAERVITACRLEQRLDGWRYHSDLVRDVRKMTKIVAPTLKNKVIAVSVRTRDAALAAEMANAYPAQLKVLLDEMGYNRAARSRRFVQGQQDKVRRELTVAENRLATFQSVNRMASLPESVVAAIKSLSDLEAQSVLAEAQARSADRVLGDARGKMESLQMDPGSLLELELRRNLSRAQSASLSGAKERFLAQLAALPPKGMELARLQREVQVLNAVYLALSQQVETAIINEDKESDAFFILDRAVAPDRHSWPRKSLMGVAGFVIGLLAAAIHLLLRSGAFAGASSSAPRSI